MNRARILLAEWRCFRGGVVSSFSMASIAGLNGSNRGEDLSGFFRAGGTGSVKACRTVSLPIWDRYASPRIDNSQHGRLCGSCSLV